MRIPIASLITGSIFGAGLALSDMINPARVLAFLDLAGAWDPSLAYVMGGAIFPMVIAFPLSKRMRTPLFEDSFFIPENRILDSRLIIGATLFGIGWGLAGFCPGPAIAGLVLGTWQIWLFVGAMLVGMVIHRIVTTPLWQPGAKKS
ncbi:MAG: YeeE/YedE family protein [Aquidulcibacter sp.]|jgi:uncharacterized membrane protein YedE/YeeE|uniref:DUF6691 family protein n=1 Tax=Aquidulcibacter sp. TaxID=2052990 RepID=UPI0022BF729F|nr:YeeE/YedE family protein [Aquidulcibacter sp.]